MEMPEIPYGFVITCDGSASPELLAWSRQRFQRTSHIENPANYQQTLVGAVFGNEVPRSYRHFQTLVLTNFKNWGEVRATRYQRGWIKYLSRREFLQMFCHKTFAEKWGSLLIGMENRAFDQ